MAHRYRKIDPRIWNDEKFRTLTDKGKLVFFFLLTHPHMTPFGVMRATLDGLAAELGWHAAPFRDAIQEACRMGMLKVDPGARCVAIPKFLKYNPPTAPNSVKAFAKTLDLIPECPMKAEAIQSLECHLGRMAPPFLDAFRDAIGDGWRDGIRDGIEQPSRITETETELETETDLSPPLSPPRGVDLVALWNEVLPHPPFATTTATAKRLAQANIRLREYPDLGFWKAVLEKATNSPFLRGAGPRGWVMSFDWLVRNDTNAHKVAEGKYDPQTLADRVRAELVPEGGVSNGQGEFPGDDGVPGRRVRPLLLPDVS